MMKKNIRWGVWAGIIVLGCMCVWMLAFKSTTPLSLQNESSRETVNAAVRVEVATLQEQEQHMAATLWGDEIQAQQAGRIVEALWDRINASPSKLKSLFEWDHSRVVLGEWRVAASFPETQIQRFRSEPSLASRVLSGDDWAAWLNQNMELGWDLETVEFRHRKFDPQTTSQPCRSEYYFQAALSNDRQGQRCLIKGPLHVDWKVTDVEGERTYEIVQWDARSLELDLSSMKPPFESILELPITSPVNAHAIDPLMVRDLDQDGVPEIVLANRNLVFRHQEGKGYTSSPLCTFPPGIITTALFADLNGDGAADFVCHKHEGLVVLPGTREGLFDQYEIMLRPSTEAISYPMVLTAGDMDADGDLDLFVGQYRVPYEAGSLPTPFYDANDGFPFYLLRNDGDLQFTDVTESVGLKEKRHRRVYSASLVEFDGKPGLDLVVVSDFAGVDLYLNDGQGNFTQAPPDMLGLPFGFGMAHAFSDFNVDGRLDLLMIGMTSPTADRLDHLGLWRAGLSEDPSMRRQMAHGNRLFLSQGDGTFVQGSMSASIARAGWAWGCSAADFNNDGYPDVYIGNGLESEQTVRDYEPEYWLHDAFIARSEPNTAAYLYFEEKFGQTRGVGHSYGGYESNRLYLNREGNSFMDVGPLWGVGLQLDTRNVVSEDLDGDGRMDLIMIHFQPWPGQKEVLSIYRNRMESTGHWISFRMVQEAGVPSHVGVIVRIEVDQKTLVQTLVSGNSYRSQHSNRLHFGLGDSSDQIKRVQFQWPDGHQIQLENLSVNRDYAIGYRGVIDINDKE